MKQYNKNNRPEMTNAGIAASYPVSVTDEFGNKKEKKTQNKSPKQKTPS